METNILQTAADLMDNGHDINQKDKLQNDKEEGQVPEFLKNRFNQDTRYKEV